MRYRPLKGADFYAKELYYGKGDGDRIKVFKAENVKSAVQGLLEEIERKKEDVDVSLSKILKGEKKDTAVNRGALYGWGEALFWVKDLIKKWFADVVEE